jgi:hypothetical protein
MSTEKSSDLIGNRTHDSPACIIVPQRITLLHAPDKYGGNSMNYQTGIGNFSMIKISLIFEERSPVTLNPIYLKFV